MNWSNLKENCCPQCSAPLQSIGMLELSFHCTKCTYKISEQRFNEIIGSMFKPRKRQPSFQEQSNTHNWNNFNPHKK